MAADDDFTELRDPDIDSVHPVGKAANGTRILFAKEAGSGGAGLFGADFVRDLLTKAEISTADQNDLPDSAFAYIEPGGEKDAEGKTTPRSLRHFPVHDAAHARNALARASQSPFGNKAMPKIRAAAAKFGVKVAKADGTDPGSPEWESADATSAQAAIAAATALHGQIKALIAREATEVGAGHLDDIPDVLDLAGACDALECVLSTLAGFAAREQLEAGDVAKAAAKAPDPSRAVHDTMSDLAQSCSCPACKGFLAASKAHDDAPTPPADATDGPAAANPQGTPPATPQEQTMTTPDATAVGTTPQTTPAAPAGDKQSKKAKKLAKSAAIEALAEQLAPITTLLTTQNELLAKQQGQIDELSKGLETVKAQPVNSGLMMNGAVPGAEPAPVHRGAAPAVTGMPGESAELTAMRKAAADATDPAQRRDLQQKATLYGLHEVFSAPPTIARG